MLILTVIVVASLVALTTAQPKPNIPSSFTANGEVEWHTAEETYFGQAMIGRDHDKKMGVEETTFNIMGKDDVEKVLQRYDLKTSVYVRGSPSDPSCSNQTRNGTMSPFWEWTEFATYEGFKTIREREYDYWSYSTGDVRLEVALEKGNATRPYFFNRKSAEEFFYFNFIEFTPKAPDAKAFEIPSQCVSKGNNYITEL